MREWWYKYPRTFGYVIGLSVGAILASIYTAWQGGCY